MPRAPRKGKELGAFGSMSAVDDKYLFGTDAEIADRVATGYATPPSQAPSNFQQIRPGNTGKDANSPAPIARAGNAKFGNGRRYL